VGTVFFVNAEEEGSHVAVIEGEVRVQLGAESKKLLRGEQLSTNPQMESLPVREEISWSRNAETHVALLQQYASTQTTPRRLEFEVVSIKR
jgi:ferric-dicitrate binding protein FerR (iron transport regulator)